MTPLEAAIDRSIASLRECERQAEIGKVTPEQLAHYRKLSLLARHAISCWYATCFD